MKSNPYHEDAMSAKSKSAAVSSAARTRVAKAPGGRARTAAAAPEAWEQFEQTPDECDDEFDCQRIVQGDSSRSLPPYWSDYD